MQLAALLVVLVFALWIAGAGILALVWPARALAAIGRFASSQQVNLVEQIGRAIAGGALALRAPEALTPVLFHWFGLTILVSAALLAVLPLRWHAAYAQWWSRNLPLPVARASGVVALGGEAALALSAIG